LRKFLLIVVSLVVVALIGAVVVLMTLDFNHYKPEVEAELEAATGRDVTIDGDIRVTFIPNLAIALEDVTVAGAPGGSGDAFLELPEVLAVVSLLPLAFFDVVVERIRLIEPVVILETRADGPASWEFEPVASTDNPGSAPPPVKIELVDIQDGRIEWRDAGEKRVFEEVDLWIVALGADGPFEARGAFHLDGKAWALDADLGRLSRTQLPVNVVLAAGDDVSLKIAGTVALDADPVAVAGQTEVRLIRLGDLARLTGHQTLPAALHDMPLRFDAGVSASSQLVHLNDLAIELGESNVTGSVLVTIGDAPAAELSLAVNRLDLDALLPLFASTGEGSESAGSDAPWPDTLLVDADLLVEAAIFRGEPVRYVQLSAGLEEGVWTLEQANALLPGGTSVAASGAVTAEDGQATFRGPVEVISDNLRGTLAWLGEPMQEIADERLRRLDFSGDVVASLDVLAVTSLDLSLDSSRLTGGVAAKLEEVPTITAEFRLDQINLDAYLPAVASEREEGEPSGALPLSLPALSPWLERANVDLELHIQALTYNGVSVSSLVADGSVLNGVLDLNTLGAADVAGAAMRTSGTIDPVAETVSLQIGLQAPDAGGVLRLAGIDLPIDPAELGAVELAGDITGDATQAVVRQRLKTDLGSFSVDGTLLEPFGEIGFDGRVGLVSGSYRALADVMGVELPEAVDSDLSFAADVTTDLDGAEFDAVLTVLDASVRSSGSVEALRDAPQFDVRAQVQHDELATLLRDVGVDGGFPDLGPIDLGLTAAGTQDLIDMALAPSVVGPSTLHGKLSMTLGTDRPSVRARLEAGELALDPFLAVTSGGTLGDTDTGQAQRWSSEEIDLGVLDALDLRLELVAERLLFQGMAIESPVVVAEAEGGVLVIERLDGRIFEGQVAINGVVEPGVPHAIELNVVLADADMAQAMRHFAENDKLTGRLFLDLGMTSAGLNQRDLIQSLAGDGSVSLRDGAVHGFDLGAISDRLGSLDDELAIAGLLAQASSGGETPITAADGTLQIDNGVVRSDYIVVVLEGGRGDFRLAADLPRWWIDLEGDARLTDHPEAPTIPIAVNGPIDGPEQVVDTRGLENFLVQRAAETALRKLGEEELGGAAGAVLDVITDDSGGSTADANVDDVEGAPLETVPSKPEAPEEPLDAAGQLLELLTGDEDTAETESQEQSGGSGGLLDLLSRSSGESSAPYTPSETPQQDDQDFDTDGLLLDLLDGFGN
tara:strand:+ start:3634 stop:7323 length:3690 start_codon:yes stop_codon:yes gene_type:complete